MGISQFVTLVNCLHRRAATLRIASRVFSLARGPLAICQLPHQEFQPGEPVQNNNDQERGEATAEDREEVMEIIEALFEHHSECDMAAIVQVFDGTIDLNIVAQVFRSLPFVSKYELHGQTLYKRPHRQKGYV